MSETIKYYGVSICEDHKTIGFCDKSAESMPNKSLCGTCGVCYWFDKRQNALNKTEELIAQGYVLHRVNEYPNYYTEKAINFQHVTTR